MDRSLSSSLPLTPMEDKCRRVSGNKLKLSHPLPFLMKMVILHFRHFTHSIHGHGLGRLKMEVSDAPTKDFIRHMRLDGVEELVEIVIQSPSCKSRNTA